jgi:L-threonylcarbamoyladenylate synthase
MSKIDLSVALKVLHEGDIVVYPTDTLYALGADAFNEDAVKKVFILKKRPFGNPISIAVSSYDSLQKIAFADQRVRRLFDHFFPGPLTLVLKKKRLVPDVVTAGSHKVAVRVPDNNVALDLLDHFGPLTATSANLHGMPVPYTTNNIRKQLSTNAVSVYLDDGRLDKKPSTIVDLTAEEPVILREGIISKDEILRMI